MPQYTYLAKEKDNWNFRSTVEYYLNTNNKQYPWHRHYHTFYILHFAFCILHFAFCILHFVFCLGMPTMIMDAIQYLLSISMSITLAVGHNLLCK
jgi:uncharacterized membrane protein